MHTHRARNSVGSHHLAGETSELTGGWVFGRVLPQYRGVISSRVIVAQVCLLCVRSCLVAATPWILACQVHEILQTRTLEWVVISYSRASSWPRDRTHLSWVSVLAGRLFITAPPGQVIEYPEGSCLSSAQSLSRVRLFATPWTAARPGLPVHHQLPEFTQTHVRWVGDAIQPSHPLLSSSPPSFNLSQHQGLFQWDSSLHQVAEMLEFQLQHQSFQWIFRTNFL